MQTNTLTKDRKILLKVDVFNTLKIEKLWLKNMFLNIDSLTGILGTGKQDLWSNSSSIIPLAPTWELKDRPTTNEWKIRK